MKEYLRNYKKGMKHSEDKTSTIIMGIWIDRHSCRGGHIMPFFSHSPFVSVSPYILIQTVHAFSYNTPESSQSAQRKERIGQGSKQ